MVQVGCLVLKLKLSQVSDTAEKEIQEPVAEKVITSEPELSLCLFVVCSLLTNFHYFGLLW